jgi:RNA polymerase sigma-70 factor (ECF subfamily)
MVPGSTPVGDDESLLARGLAQGDANAADAFIRAYHARVASLVFRLLGWSADADDVVQEVFVSALGSAGSFRREAELMTWLTRITLNKCRNWQRRRLVWRGLLGRLGRRGQASSHPPADLPVDAAEARGRVREAIRRLPARYREVIVLRYLEQMSAEEIGRVLGLTRTNVEVRLNRARERLRTMLGDVLKE